MMRCAHRHRGSRGLFYACVKAPGHWWPWHLDVYGSRWLSRDSS